MAGKSTLLTIRVPRSCDPANASFPLINHAPIQDPTYGRDRSPCHETKDQGTVDTYLGDIYYEACNSPEATEDLGLGKESHRNEAQNAHHGKLDGCGKGEMGRNARPDDLREEDRGKEEG